MIDIRRSQLRRPERKGATSPSSDRPTTHGTGIANSPGIFGGHYYIKRLVQLSVIPDTSCLRSFDHFRVSHVQPMMHGGANKKFVLKVRVCTIIGIVEHAR